MSTDTEVSVDADTVMSPDCAAGLAGEDTGPVLNRRGDGEGFVLGFGELFLEPLSSCPHRHGASPHIRHGS